MQTRSTSNSTDGIIHVITVNQISTTKCQTTSQLPGLDSASIVGNHNEMFIARFNDKMVTSLSDIHSNTINTSILTVVFST